MLDIRYVRSHPDRVKEACRRKRIEADVDALLAADARALELKRSFEDRRAEQNRRGKEIGKLSGPDKQRALDDVKALSQEVKDLEAALKDAEEVVRRHLLLVPQVPADDVPAGKDDTENVEVRRVGEPPAFAFEPKDHVDLGSALDLLDIERATRIAGSRTYFLKGAGALLELAVLRLTLDRLVAKGFVPMIVPHLVRSEAMEGTAYLPGGEAQAYQTNRDESWLIGTSEVPLTSYYMGEILDHGDLPVKLAGWSTCYRREAGTYGKDTRGLYRIHQFQKIEQVILCRDDEEESLRWHHEILANAEAILEELELPYRVVNVCDGDLGRPQVQKFDVETWMPSRGGYGETHSASRFHDYQARRLNLRYRDADGKVRFCHTLNNTAIASPRILIPLLEINQREDGSVAVPEALRPYMGGVEVMRKE